ncbi:hypothetical protein [Oscillatoria acuminata]|uniref:hypothetical protein n=1 Tax=Oscillatoria acuminata TaxID=118323 RepID=UPI000304796C|nr:hypothetical protein [Oscillatoria acuminata]
MGKIQCPPCNGDIELWFPYWESEEESQSIDRYSYYAQWIIAKCGFCDGTGEIDSDSDRFCEECNGTGEDSEGYECSACNATGICWDGDWEDEFVRDTADD